MNKTKVSVYFASQYIGLLDMHSQVGTFVQNIQRWKIIRKIPKENRDKLKQDKNREKLKQDKNRDKLKQNKNRKKLK